MGIKPIKAKNFMYEHGEDYDAKTNFRYYNNKQRAEFKKHLYAGEVEKMTCPNNQVENCFCPRCVLLRLREHADKTGMNDKYANHHR